MLRTPDVANDPAQPVPTRARDGTSPRQLARIAGTLYLINIVGGAFAISIIPAMLLVPGNAAAAAHNIQTDELLYRSALRHTLWRRRRENGGADRMTRIRSAPCGRCSIGRGH